MPTKIVLLFLALFAALPATAASTEAQANAKQSVAPSHKEDVLFIDLRFGRILIKMHPELAPKHVARIKQLVGQGFYNGRPWFRVIDGFMAQTGASYGDKGGSGQTIPAEINAGPVTRGSVFMSHGKDINSADSQFFILLGEAPHIKGNFTYWGEVISGMDVVDQIAKGDPSTGRVYRPDRIMKMGLLSNE
jgi:peptidylprolyl isomerase